MARIFTCGWETGLRTEDGGTVTSSNGSAGIATSSPTPRSGAYCLKCGSGIDTGAFSADQIPLGASPAEIYVRLGLYPGFNGGANADLGLVILLDSAGAGQLYLTLNPVTNLLKVYRGAWNTGTLLATATNALTNAAWHCLEFRAAIDDSTGVFQVWADQSLIIDYSGDTRGGLANVAFIKLAAICNGAADGGNGWYIAYDDVAVNDTTGAVQNGRCGDGSVLLLKPSGNGTTSGLTGSDGNQVDNYALVDEVPPGTSDYVGSTAVDAYDTYALGDVPAVYSSVTLVQPIAYAALAAAGTGSINTVIRSSTVEYQDAADQAITVSYAFYRGDVRYAEPGTSGAWTPSLVNGLESGAKVR